MQLFLRSLNFRAIAKDSLATHSDSNRLQSMFRTKTDKNFKKLILTAFFSPGSPFRLRAAS